MSEETPKIHIDSDWKAQAEAERERLAKIEGDRAADGRRGGPESMPPADFRSLVGVLASQALSGLGMYGDPDTKRIVVDLPASRFAIDLLGVLDEKTKGNLGPEEAKELTEVLAELRARFVHFARLMAEQQARGGAVGAATAAAVPGDPASMPPASASAAPAASRIVMP
jgi:hypothetical protein